MGIRVRPGVSVGCPRHRGAGVRGRVRGCRWVSAASIATGVRVSARPPGRVSAGRRAGVSVGAGRRVSAAGRATVSVDAGGCPQPRSPRVSAVSAGRRAGVSVGAGRRVSAAGRATVSVDAGGCPQPRSPRVSAVSAGRRAGVSAASRGRVSAAVSVDAGGCPQCPRGRQAGCCPRHCVAVRSLVRPEHPRRAACPSAHCIWWPGRRLDTSFRRPRQMVEPPVIPGTHPASRARAHRPVKCLAGCVAGGAG